MNALSSVLLIEDNPGDARLVREHLSDRFGTACRLHEATTLGGGLRWLDSQRVDLILLDLSLPDSQGLDTFYSVHAHAPDTPVVILSGRDDDEFALDAVRAGAEDYLAKQHADSVALARSMRHAVERRKIERALRECEARYKAIVETAEEGILQIDAHRAVRFVNTSMANLLAWPAKRMLGRRFEEWVHPDHTDDVIAFLSACAPDARRTMQVRLQRPDGGDFWAIMSVGSVHAFGSETFDIVVMLTDITERVLAEKELADLALHLEERVGHRTAQLEAANAELALFNHSIAHDLRTPLNAIVGFASLLESDPAIALSSKAVHQLAMVQQGAEDMGDLVSAMLALSQIGRTKFRRLPLNLSTMARGVLEQLQATAPLRTVEIDIEDGVHAQGDPALVRDVLLNLLSNAWKYTGQAEAPWIHFGVARREAGETVYVVQDNGVGFDMKSIGMLFQPFHRLASSEGFEGTGIGLATVHRIVQRHGGRIWAESLAGQRTSFFFTLQAPAATPPGSSPAELS
jgi:PAS domain S-box-containing protein